MIAVPLLPLPGFARDRRGFAWSLVLVLGVLASRVLLLPDGPWEQDEALFATGVVDFDVLRHQPHPPGFPGWIAIGKVLRPCVGDPLRALQIASSLGSTLLFVVLAQLLVRFTPGASATLAALAFTLCPIVWAHSPRAFTSMPAVAIAAFALWWWHREGRAVIVGWMLLGVAATVRPQLAPELAVLALAGIALTRTRLRLMLLGIALALGVVVLAGAIVVIDSGGVAPTLRAFTDHFARHEAGTRRAITWTSIGFVRGFGHPAVALVLVIAAALGALVLGRTRPWLAAFCTLLIAVTAWMVLVHHHPGFPRYAIGLVLVLVPPAAVLVQAVLGPRAALAWGVLAVTSAAASLPILVAMHGHPLPPVAAVRAVASTSESTPFRRERGEDDLGRERAVTPFVVSHGQFSFVRYAALAGELAVPIVDVTAIDAIPPFPRGAHLLGGATVRFVGGATVCERVFDEFPSAARPLSQGRFESARLARDAIVLGRGVHALERDPEGRPFAWLSDASVLLVPGTPTRLVLVVDVPSSHAPRPWHAYIGDTFAAEGRLAAGLQRIEIPLPGCVDGCTVTLRSPDARTSTRDGRRLSMRLVLAWAEGLGFVEMHHAWSPGDPHAMHHAGARIEGFHEPERFARGRPGAWTNARAKIELPARPGKVRLAVARPRHTQGDVKFTTDAETRTLAIGSAVQYVELAIAGTGDRTSITIESPVFIPKQVNRNSTDARTLGLIVFDVELVPEATSEERCPFASLP